MRDIDHLIDGLRRFLDAGSRDGGAEASAVAPERKSPPVMMIACADLAADPQALTGAGPGELYVIRNLANLVPPYSPDNPAQGTSAALEFGVRRLGVEHIVVIGHNGCAGMKALLDAGESAIDDPIVGEFMPTWLALGVPAVARALRPDIAAPARAGICEREAVRLSLENLMSYPWIFDRVMERRLHLHGWYVDLAAAALERFNPEIDEFEV